MATEQDAKLKEGALTSKVKPSAAGTDGGWMHVKALKARHVTPTKIVSTDCESSWIMYDKSILNPREWGKTNEMWRTGLRDWPEPELKPNQHRLPKWSHSNTKRWPLRRQPRYGRRGVEVYV